MPLDESLSLADYNTLRKVAEYMGAGNAAPAPVPAPVEQAQTTQPDAPAPAHAEIVRRIPVLRAEPSLGQRNDLPSGRVVVVGGEDGVPRAALEEAGWALTGEGPVVGLVAVDAKPHGTGETLGALFDAAKANPDVAFVLVMTKQDGGHGLVAPRDADMAALAGLGKALKKEFPKAVVKVVDVHPDLPLSLAVDELQSGGGRTEVCFDADGTRHVVDVAPEPIEGTPDVARKTLVVSGGAQGITVELLASLAPQKPNLLLLGRTEVPEEAADWATWDEARWKQEEQAIMARMKDAGERVTPVALQKALSPMQKAADVSRNLQRLTDLGAEVIYSPVDVTDAEAVQEAVTHARARFGAIDGVIHAAGVEISKDLASKDRSQFDMVVGIKKHGFEALMAATAEDDLQWIVGFGSVAGRFGNIGQTDYSAANEWLCKAVQVEAAQRGAATGFTVAWGPWGEVGMATKGSILTIMEQSGVTPIPTADGVRFFLAEMATPGHRESVVAGTLGAIDADGQVVTSRPDSALDAVRAKLADRLLLSDVSVAEPDHVVATVTMDQSAHPWARDHAIDGVPYLPGVFGIESFAQAVSLVADGVCLGASDIRFGVPVKQLKDRPVDAQVDARRTQAGWVCTLTTRMVGPDGVPRGDPRVHFEATLRFGAADPPVTTKDVPECTAERGADSIYPPFFHGPSFQVLREAGPLGDESIGTGRLPYAAAFDAEPTFWTHPLVTEALFQICGLRTMAEEDAMSLPAGIETLDILSQEDPEGPFRLWSRYGGHEDGLRRFDAVAATPDGRVLVRLLGYTMVETGAAPTATTPEPEPVEPAPAKEAKQVQQTLASDLPIPTVDPGLPDVEGVVFAAVEVAEADPDPAWFTDDERAQAEAFPADKRRTEWLAGRLAAKAACVSVDSELGPLDVTVVNEETGKPVLHVRGAPAASTLSITHRDGLAIAALGDAIGIDLETIEERSGAFDEQAFNDAEKALAATPQGAACVWAAKEAVFKRLGTGLKQALHAWTVAPDGQGGATCSGPDGSFGVRFFDLDGRILAVTVPTFDLTVDA